MRYLLSFILLFCGAAPADWTGIGPPAGPIYSGAISASNPQVVYAAPMSEPCRVLRSTDGGNTWVFTSDSLSRYPLALAAEPANPDVVYAASGTMHKTTNGGVTWAQLSGPASVYCRDIAINPQNPQTVYVGGYSYGGANRVVVGKTTDAGATWSVLVCDSTSSKQGYAVGVDPVDTSVIYTGGQVVGSATTTVYKSTDAGASWARVSVGSASTPYALLVSVLDHRFVLLGAGGGLYRSTDAGASWARIDSFTNVNRLAEAPAEPSVIYAATASTTYRSDDTGRTWVQAGNGLVGTGTFCLFASAGNDSTVFRGTKAGMYCSPDRGANWAPAMSEVAFNRTAAIGLASGNSTLYVECRDNAVFRTSDNGATWSRSPEFLSCGNICGVAVSPANPDVVWALEGSG